MKKMKLLCTLLCAMQITIHASETKKISDSTIPEAPTAPTEQQKETDTKQRNEKKTTVESKIKVEARTAPLHDVIIFINNDIQSPTGDPVTSEFALALCQSFVPIIVTNNVLKNFFELAKKNEPQDYNQVIDAWKNSFDQWRVYITKNNDLYLLIPKKYLERKRTEVNSDSFEKEIKEKGFKLTNTVFIDSILLGFSIWHLTQIKKFEDIEPKSWLQSGLAIESLTSLFVAMKDDIFGLWNIYLHGHGKYSESLKTELFSTLFSHNILQLKESEFADASIAGMKLNQFRSLIQFFNGSINTNFLYYKTCYGGGYNKILPYLTNIENTNNRITGSKKPHFLIANGSISESVVLTDASHVNWCASCLKSKKGFEACIADTRKCGQKDQNIIDFQCFFETLNSKTKKEGVRPTLFNNEELQQILKPITARVKSTDDPHGISALPQILFPETDIFTTVDIDGTISVITNVRAKQQMLDKKPIIIDETKNVILLYPDTISGTISIKTTKQLSIVSMIPGISLQTIDTIDTNMFIKTFFDSFNYGKKDPFIKYFYINTLKVLDGNNSPIELHNVLIMVGKDELSYLYIKVNPQNSSNYEIFNIKNNTNGILSEEQPTIKTGLIESIEYYFFGLKTSSDLSKQYKFDLYLNTLIIAREDSYKNKGLHRHKNFLLVKAMNKNDEKKVWEMLNTPGINVNVKDQEGNTLLIWATKKRNMDIVSLLLEKGGVNLDVQTKDSFNTTPLLHATLSGNINLVNLLLEKLGNKLDVNAKNNAGLSPLMYALKSNKKEIALLLIEKGGDQLNINAKDTEGNSPIHLAVINEDLKIITLLLEKWNAKIDVNSPNNSGNTPLHMAVFFGNKEIVTLLLEKGADVNAKNNDNETPLSNATGEIKELLEKYAKDNNNKK